jgi:DnaK suppressor protein
MAQQITTTDSENTHQKRVLKAMLAELLGASTRIEDLRVENLADPLDQIKSALDRETIMNQLDARAHLVQDIRAALDAINDGTYGFCESCEERIPLKRLNVGTAVRAMSDGRRIARPGRFVTHECRCLSGPCK